MKAALWFPVLACAFVVWLFVVIWQGAGDPQTGHQSGGPDPPPEPPSPLGSAPRSLASIAASGDDGWRRVTVPPVARRPVRTWVGGYLASGFPAWWLRGALCVHRGEGGWHANTGNGYHGGMQFAPSTWRSNGGLRFASYAHLATPHQQLLVAYWLWRRAGWAPWPTTARRCGLL